MSFSPKHTNAGVRTAGRTEKLLAQAQKQQMIKEAKASESGSARRSLWARILGRRVDG